MKKSACSGSHKSAVRKTILIMKLSVFFLLLAMQISAVNYGQKYLNLQESNIALQDVLKKIENQSSFRFYYSNDVLPSQKLVSINVVNASLDNVMEKVLEGTGLHWKVIRYNRVVITLTQNDIHGVSPAKTITGSVINEKGEPLAGASVVIKGTTTGTVTKEDGTFAINANQGDVLIISIIGYNSQEVKVGDSNNLTISLTTISRNMDEVVVVGYGTQIKSKLTSAVATVSGQDLNKRVATNSASLLQGQLPGLQVVQGSGEPGNENISLRIRGISTFSGAGNDPLVIVDGIPGSLGILNPNDIESVSLLKDAASAAIYGSRGANGVIMIKTKKGKTGTFTMNYNYNIGIAKPTALPDVISNSAEFMELSNEAYTNSGRQPLYTQTQIDLYKNATDRVKYPNHRWLDDLFQTAYIQNHYLSMSGGKEGTNYNVSLGYSDQPGIMIGFNYKKYTMDLGLMSKVSKWITFGTNVQMRYGSKSNPPQGAGDQFLSTLAQSPLYPPQAPNGQWIKRMYSNEQGNKNTIAIANNIFAHTNDYYMQGNFSIDLNLHKNLTWENRAGMNYWNSKYNDFRPVINLYYYNDMSSAGLLDVGTPGLSVRRDDNVYTVYYSQLNYKNKFGEKHNLSILGGFQEEVNDASYLSGFRKQFTTNILRELNAGPADGMTNNGSSSRWAIRSLYGNANYDYNDKYLFSTSMRYDGTSRLPNDTRWGIFYSFAGAWRISKESFMQNLSGINDMKIRASWGQLGNQNIGAYPYQATLSSSSYAFGGVQETGYSASTLVDPSLTWETTRVLDIGLDMTVLQNRLTVNADWYNKYTFDILRGSQVPLWLGLNAPIINNGAVRNKGFEFSTQWKDRISNNISYFIGFNMQRYKNSLVEYGSKEIGGNSIREEGHELDGFYMYIWDGIFQSVDEIANSPKQPITPTPGDLKIKDINGDNVINDKDRTYVSGKYPAYQYAANLGVTWKKIDLGVQLYGSQGQKIYVTGWGIEPFRQGSVPSADWRSRWTPTNHNNSMPKIYVADGYQPVQGYNSTYYLKDAAFLRIKNISVGYNFPINQINNVIKGMRIYFTADNVATFSKFPGLDPERAGSGNYVTYPQVRTFTFGASIQF